MGPADWNTWFWDVALDGIVGVAVTGALAVWAVQRTVKHESQETARTELRQALNRLRSLCLVRINALAGTDDNRTRVDRLLTLSDALMEAHALALNVDKSLSDDLAVLVDALLADDEETVLAEDKVVMGIMTGAAACARLWISSPRTYNGRDRLLLSGFRPTSNKG